MISYYGQSDIGRRRSGNEDYILTEPDLFVVCDGMGGHKAGEVASRLAVETIAHLNGRDAASRQDASPGTQDDSQRLSSAIKRANHAIRQKASSSEDFVGMGTTVAAVLMATDGVRVSYANVGDSRIYLIRDAAIVQMTRDDSWANLALGPDDPVDAASAASMQHVLTKALGTHDDLDFEVKHHELKDGDVLLLCSDGLTNMLTDDEILRVIQAHGSDLDGAGKQLVDAANDAGGRDNISAVLVRYSA